MRGMKDDGREKWAIRMRVIVCAKHNLGIQVDEEEEQGGSEMRG